MHLRAVFNITNIELQNKEYKLDAETFDEISHELKKLQSFDIPEGITAIGDSAFADYEDLTSVTIPSTVTEIGLCVFCNCKKLENIIISKDNKNYYMSDGILYDKDGTVVYCPENKKEDCEFDTSVLTETPVVLKKGTDGTYGREGTYVLFGDWPQTIKSDDVIIDEKHRYNINGWESYKGSDGYYYVKATVKPDKDVDNPTFSNGVKIRNGDVYYFKLESIKWRILDNNYGGGKLLLSEQALTAGCYDTHFDEDEWGEIKRTVKGKTVHANNYEYSRIRAYLNGLDGSSYDVEDYRDRGFIDKAFSEKAIAKIRTVTVDNGKESTIDSCNILDTADKYVCKNTQDKLFLLSEREVTKAGYGFDEYDRYIGDDEGTKTSTRIRKATDYSKASGVWYDTENNSWLWLRSPNYLNSYLARGVGIIGSAYDGYSVYDANGGVVPALSISF